MTKIILISSKFQVTVHIKEHSIDKTKYLQKALLNKG